MKIKMCGWINIKDKLPLNGTRILAYCKPPNSDDMVVAECWFQGNDFLHEFLLYGKYSVYVSDT